MSAPPARVPCPTHPLLSSSTSLQTLAYVGVVNGIVLGIDKKLKLEAKEHGLEKVLAEIGTLQQEVKHASVDEKHGKTVDAAEMGQMKKDFKKFHVDVQALMSF
jgi:hypothetical protein